MILVTSRFRVANGLEAEVAEAFRQRPRRVDDRPGFLGMEVFTDRREPAVFHLLTRWTDIASYEAWHGSEHHHESHAGIPRGLKLDPASTLITQLDRLEAVDPAGRRETEVADAGPLLASFLQASEAVCLVVADRGGRLKSTNPAFAARLGRTVEEVQGTSIWSLLVAGERDSLKRRVEQAERRPGDRFLVHFVDAEGNPLTLSCQLDVRPDGFVLVGEPPGQDRAFDDELARINSELAVLAREHARQGRELQRSNNELQQFTAVASHDLQEPLRTITSYLRLLERHLGAALDERARAFLDFTLDGSQRMQRMIEDLLALARVQSRELELTTVDLEATLDVVLHDLEGAIAESGGTVRRDPLPHVRGDAGQLAQLLQNLISNALKFHGPQPPEVEVRSARKGSEWQLSVADNGIGIAPQDAERVFEAFQRLHGREQIPGTGIGLAICQRIVERHGGRIWLDTTHGAGSTFHFTLPAAGPTP